MPVCIVDWHRLEWRYYNDWTMLKKDENCKNMDSNSCKKEWEFLSAQKDEVCCAWLKQYYWKPWNTSFSICYNESKGKPNCIIDWHRLEWRYYSNGTLLKQDVNCK